ncbi:GL12904 [Drosophila persimilis]|uniref:GL12904 n=1 Tax=Drosophila persimilis TaxID=7234 RepID=B4GV51_DROPE|nr:GL12904 [Drosophila persimilis]
MSRRFDLSNKNNAICHLPVARVLSRCYHPLQQQQQQHQHQEQEQEQLFAQQQLQNESVLMKAQPASAPNLAQQSWQTV